MFAQLIRSVLLRFEDPFAFSEIHSRERKSHEFALLTSFLHFTVYFVKL